MKILSLFDGISCARVALERAGIPVERYFASEIEKPTIKISENNWKDIIHIGDVKMVAHKDAPIHYKLNDIDLLIGGSPCQDLSIAKKERKGLEGERSGLFWEYVRILNEVKPRYFILENVASMPKVDRDIITKTLGVEPIIINAGLVSAQNRKRLFWVGKRVNGSEPDAKDFEYTTVEISQPYDRKIMAWDIIEDMEEKTSIYQYRRTYWREIKSGKLPTLTANMGTGGNNVPYVLVKEATKDGYAIAFPGNTVDTTFPNSKTRRGRVGDKIKNVMTGNGIKIFNGKELRPITITEIERSFGLKDGYTLVEGVSNTARKKALGNAFNVDVVAHIVKHLK